MTQQEIDQLFAHGVKLKQKRGATFPMEIIAVLDYIIALKTYQGLIIWCTKKEIVDKIDLGELKKV